MENIEKEIQKNHWSILASLSEFEDYRKEAYTKKRICEFLAFISPIAGIVLVFMFIFGLVSNFFSINYDIAFWLGFGCLLAATAVSVILTVVIKDIVKDFKSKLKNNCLKDALKAFGDIEWLENKSKDEMQEGNIGLNNEVLKRSALFANYNRRYIDDEFVGKYNGVDFAISETRMLHESRSGKNRSVVEIFKGVIVQFDSNKKVLNRTMISSKGDLKTGKDSAILCLLVLLITYLLQLFEYIAENGVNIFFIIMTVIFVIFIAVALLFYKKKDEPLNKVTLEDPEFNKKFNVYSSDQVEARYLVTPSFMERLNNLTTAFGCKDVKCSFFDDKFMIAISTKKDLFEIGKINAPLSNPETLENFYKELSSIYEMIDYFKLDEKTGI